MRLTFDLPEERRTAAGGRVTIEVVRLAGMPVLRISHAPGWRWSRHSAPEVGGERCQAVHVGVMVAGEMAVEEADGGAYVLCAGDPVAIAPGHDVLDGGRRGCGPRPDRRRRVGAAPLRAPVTALARIAPHPVRSRPRIGQTGARPLRRP